MGSGGDSHLTEGGVGKDGVAWAKTSFRINFAMFGSLSSPAYLLIKSGLAASSPMITTLSAKPLDVYRSASSFHDV